MKMKTWKLMLAGSLVAAAGGAALAGVGSDSCGSAEPITGPGTYPFNTTGATQDGFPSCGIDDGTGAFYPSDDVWFAYTPSTPGQANIVVTVSPELQAAHLLVTTACTGGDELVCSPDAGPYSEGFNFSTAAGQTYLIRLGGYTSFGYVGAGSFTITEAAAPDNDTCDGALDVGAGIYTWDDTAAGQDGPAGSCTPATPQRDVWYRYFASTNGNAVITVGTSVQNTNFDSTITVFDACDGNEVLCASRPGGGRYWAGFPVVNGGEYLVRLSRGTETAPGSPCCGFSLQFAIDEYAAGDIPTNTSAATATPITGPGSYDFNNAGVITDDPKPTCSPYGTAQTAVWFKYTPTQTGLIRYRASTEANRTTVVDVFADAAGTTPITCGWFNYADSPFKVAGVTQNVPVYLRIFNYTDAGNNDFYRAGTLVIEEGAAAPNDNCATPATAVLGGNSFNTSTATNSTGIADAACSFTSPSFADVWFAFTPAQSGEYGFDTCSDITAYQDTNLAVYSSCNGAQLACNDNLDYVYFPDSCRFASWGWNQSAFTYTLTGGTQYLVRVGTQGGSAGQLNIALVTPACQADFNQVNGVTVQDIFDFLTAWLAGNSSADFNQVNGVTVQDIFDFLTAWLAGC